MIPLKFETSLLADVYLSELIIHCARSTNILSLKNVENCVLSTFVISHATLFPLIFRSIFRRFWVAFMNAKIWQKARSRHGIFPSVITNISTEA